VAVSIVPAPPWQGRPAPPERTPEGQEIIRTRFGAFLREGGHFIPYYTPEQWQQKLFGQPRGLSPFRGRTDWSPFEG
jgi:hypothetical protein